MTSATLILATKTQHLASETQTLASEAQILASKTKKLVPETWSLACSYLNLTYKLFKNSKGTIVHILPFIISPWYSVKI